MKVSAKALRKVKTTFDAMRFAELGRKGDIERRRGERWWRFDSASNRVESEILRKTRSGGLKVRNNCQLCEAYSHALLGNASQVRTNWRRIAQTDMMFRLLDW